jgi:TolA-binding protein
MCAYKQALVLLELGDEAKARRVLNDLAESFPNSTYTSNATGLAASLAP